MPTGYTAELHDGEQSFEEFVWRCARAFGALLHLRDSPLENSKPKHDEPSTYSRNAWTEAQLRLSDLRSMSAEEADIAARRVHEDALSAWRERTATADQRRRRYSDMLADVEQWQPPTEKHQGLKRFMIEQLTESMKHDCYVNERPELQTGEGWRAAEIERAEWSVNYHEKQWAEERERVAGRNAWVDALAASLNGEP